MQNIFLCHKASFIVTKQKSHLRGFLLLSFVIHLAITLFLGSGILKQFFPKSPPPDTPPPTLTMLEMVQPESFIPTEEWQKTDHPDPHALLQSDRSTALRSQEAPQKPDSPLPQLSGDPRSSMSYIDQPASRPSPPRPSGRSTPAQKQAVPTKQIEQENQQNQASSNNEAKMENKSKQETKENHLQKDNQKLTTKSEEPTPTEKPSEDNPSKVLEKLLKEINKPSEEFLKKEDPNGDPLMPFQNKTPKEPAKATEKETSKNATAASTTSKQTDPSQPNSSSQFSPPPNPPPSPESFEKHRMQISGGRTAELGPVSPSARETELGRYKARLYRAIGSRWYLEVEQNMGLLAIGSVRVRFYVQSDGTISSLQVISEDGITEVLRSISLDSIRLSAPFGPFSEAMKGQIGDGFWEEITFTIY